MPYFFLNLRSSEGLHEDEEGAHYCTFSEAALDAERTKVRYLEDAIAEGRDDSDCSIEVVDTNGSVLLRVPFHSIH